MKNKLLLIILSSVIALLFSGCWSRREPKDLAMVNSVLTDIKDDGEYEVTQEIMNTSSQSSGSAQNIGGATSSAIIIVCNGKTPAEAARDQAKSIDKGIFGGHNKARFFSEKLARKGLAPVIDFFTRDHLTDEMPLLIVVKGQDPQKIYSSMTGLSSMIGNYIDNLSKSQHKSTSESVFTSTLDFIKDYYEEGKEPVAGLIEIVKNEGKSISGTASGTQGTQNTFNKDNQIIYKGLAAFKGDKLVGYFDGIETRAYNFITNKLTDAIVAIPTGNDFTTATIVKSKSKIITIILNGQAEISVKIKPVFTIVEEGSNIDPNKIETQKMLAQGFNSYLETEIAASVQKAQRGFGSDIFGFGSYVHAQHPKDWEEIKENWNDIFSKAKINVTVESSIVMTGEYKRSFILEGQTYDK